MTVSVAPPAPSSAPSNTAISNPPSPGLPATDGSGPASFKSTYEDVQHQNSDSPGQPDANAKGTPGKNVTSAKKDPRDAALVELAALTKPPAPPLSLQISALPKTNGASVSSTGTGTTDSPQTPTPADATTHSLTPTLDQLLPPLPPPASSSSPNQDVAFALRLLGRESTTAQGDASRTLQTTTLVPAAPSAVPASRNVSTPALPTPTPKAAAPGAALPLPTGKEIAASAPQVPVRESAPSDPASAKPRSASPAPESPKVAPKQPTQEESSKGNDTPGGTQRELLSAAPLKTVDARYSATSFAEVHDVASTTAPEPAANNTPAPLNTHPDALVPLKTNEAPAPVAANDISLRLNGPDQSSATVRVLDRSGEIHVSVRASDPQLATTLRSDVDQLRTHLNSRGWDAEVWKPEGTPTLREAANHANSGQEHAFSGKRDGQSQSQSRQQQNSSGKRPAWLDELEESTQGGQ